MKHISQKYISLFDIQSNESSAALQDVFRYRTKTIKSGDMLECEIYPIWNTNKQVRKARVSNSRKAQKALNDKNAKKRLIRLINTNFGCDDIAITLTYADEVPDLETVRRDMQNYIRRVRAYRRKNGLPEMKYVYVIEHKDEYGKSAKRIHHHIIMSGMNRDDAENLWGWGWANSRKLQPNEQGLEAIARYMTKEPHSGGKRWCCSRNLKKPTVTVSDNKISRRKVARLAEDLQSNADCILKAIYKDYAFVGCEMSVSNYVSGVYIYALMQKKTARKSRGKKGG